MDYQTKRLLRDSLDYYDSRDGRSQEQSVQYVKKQLRNHNNYCNRIGIRFSSHIIYASELFLYIINRRKRASVSG